MREFSTKPDRLLSLAFLYFVLLFTGLVTFTETVSAATKSNAIENNAIKDAQYNKAPHFNLPNIFSKAPVQLSDYQGKVVLIDFWASWCGPCRQSLPEYDELRTRLRQQSKGEDFEILAINVDVTTEEAIHFLERYPVSFPVLEERSGKSQQAYDLLTMPTSFLVDREGYIRIAHQGFNSGYIHYLEKEVESLLNE